MFVERPRGMEAGRSPQQGGHTALQSNVPRIGEDLATPLLDPKQQYVIRTLCIDTESRALADLNSLEKHF
jgi:hypothetical protein